MNMAHQLVSELFSALADFSQSKSIYHLMPRNRVIPVFAEDGDEIALAAGVDFNNLFDGSTFDAACLEYQHACIVAAVSRNIPILAGAGIDQPYTLLRWIGLAKEADIDISCVVIPDETLIERAKFRRVYFDDPWFEDGPHMPDDAGFRNTQVQLKYIFQDHRRALVREKFLLCLP